MQLFRFPSVPISRFASRFSMTHVLCSPGPARANCAYLPAAGLIGRHQTMENQLLVVIAGDGWVSGEDNERRSIKKDEAAFWTVGETHETGSDNGLTALVLEGSGVDPSNFMPGAISI